MLDPSRFQFKSGTNIITGVKEDNRLAGEWDVRTAGNLYLWQDRSGKNFVVNGHHRFQLAIQKNVRTVNAVIDYETDGVTASAARRNGVLINIRDGQGEIMDYAVFVRADRMTEETAEKEGLLAREKGRLGFSIGHYASDNLFTLYQMDEIDDRKTSIIADICRGDEGLEAAGIRAAKNGMPGNRLQEFLLCLQHSPRQKMEQQDLFGFDDSAIRTAETLAKIAAKHILEVKEKVNAAKSAIKRPDAAAALGVSVDDDAASLLQSAILTAAKWDKWYMDPELYNQLLAESGLADDNPELLRHADQLPEPEQSPEPDTGRFNLDSDVPLLSDEEDAGDFTLFAETAVECRRNDLAAERAEKEAVERADREAMAEYPDLFAAPDPLSLSDLSGLSGKTAAVSSPDMESACVPVPADVSDSCAVSCDRMPSSNVPADPDTEYHPDREYFIVIRRGSISTIPKKTFRHYSGLLRPCRPECLYRPVPASLPESSCLPPDTGIRLYTRVRTSLPVHACRMVLNTVKSRENAVPEGPGILTANLPDLSGDLSHASKFHVHILSSFSSHNSWDSS